MGEFVSAEVIEWARDLAFLQTLLAGEPPAAQAPHAEILAFPLRNGPARHSH